MFIHWAKAGGLLFIAIIIYVLFFTPYKTFSLQTIAWLNLAFLMLHQFEEYVYPGGFMDFFNNYLYGKKRIMRFRIKPVSAFHVNVTLGWGIYLLCAVTGGQSPFFVMIITTISFINGLAHTGAAVIFRKYTPGLITGLFIFIPFSVFVFFSMMNNGLNSGLNWIYIIILAAAGTPAIPITLYIFKEKINL